MLIVYRVNLYNNYVASSKQSNYGSGSYDYELHILLNKFV